MQKNIKKVFQKERKYSTKIFALMLCLLLGLLLPFSILLQQRASEYVRQSIDDSNQLFLHQMKNDYDVFRDNISAICLSTFYDRDVQEILYNTEPDYANIFTSIHRIKSSTLSAQPSIYSVDIYNAKQEKIYTTRSDGADVKEELATYFAQANDISKLTPVLRKVNVGTTNDAYTYVFSYFMFDHQPPKTMDGSFLVINQKAGWFVNALSEVTSSTFETSVFLADTSEMVLPYNNTNNQTEMDLLWECVKKIKQGALDAESGNYITKTTAGKFLVSYISMDDNQNVLVLIQNYGEVFFSMIQMRNEFVFLILLCSFLGIVVVVLFSKRLYRPVDELFSYVEELNNADQEEILAVCGDELSKIQGALDHYKVKSQELENQNGLQGAALKKMMLSSLLQGMSESDWEKSKKIFPDLPLSNQTQWNLFVAIIKINEWRDDEDSELTIEDEENVFSNIYSILLGMTENGIVERSKQKPWENVYILNVAEYEIENISDYLRKLVALTAEKLNISITVSCSEMGSALQELPQLYKEAQRYLQYRLLFGNAFVLNKERCAANEANTNTSYSARVEKKLLDGIRCSNLETVTATLNSLREEFQQLRYEYVLANVIELVTKIKMCIGEKKDVIQSTEFAEMYPQILSASTLPAMFEIINAYLTRGLQIDTYRDTFADIRDQRFVEQIKAYIELHYADENLSLQAVAEYMNMSVRYVSKKFKQYTDLFINDYILSFRMQKAAELLLETDVSIEQIAIKIGITNSNYFYRLFKKQFGCTPRDFARRAKMLN